MSVFIQISKYNLNIHILSTINSDQVFSSDWFASPFLMMTCQVSQYYHPLTHHITIIRMTAPLMSPQAGMTSTASGVSDSQFTHLSFKFGNFAATTTECYDCTTTSKFMTFDLKNDIIIIILTMETFCFCINFGNKYLIFNFFGSASFHNCDGCPPVRDRDSFSVGSGQWMSLFFQNYFQ